MIEDPNEIRIGLANEFVTKTKEYLGEKFVRAYAFGSTARYGARPDSDVDMMIIIKPENNIAETMQKYTQELRSIAAKFKEEYGIKMSPFWVRNDLANHSTLAKIAKRDGILIDSI